MEAFTIMTCIISLFIALTLIHNLITSPPKNKKLPPGPKPFPIIGSLHELGVQPHKSLAELAKKYGPIISLKLGFTTTVVISSSSNAKEVLQKQDLAFSNRAVADALHALDHSKYSVIFLPVCARWRSLRKILNTHIFSVSRLDANQHLRTKKVEELILYCKKKSESGESMDVGQAAFATSLNLLSNTLFSVDLTNPFDDSAKEFKDLVWNIMVEAGKPNLVDFFPFLGRFDPQGIRRRMNVHFGKALQIFKELINQRMELRKLGKTSSNDVLDVCLNIAQEDPDEMDPAIMEHMFLDLFAAGNDTTGSTLEWAMTELLRNPKTMIKAKSELKEIIGKGKIVKEADVSRLPYLGCIMKETLRIHPPVPLLVPRKVESDVELCGYIVQKDSQLLVNAWAIGRDSSLWEEPLSFKPERFLGSEIDIRGRDFELIPFGAGRRICPGIPLAVRTVPMMLGSMINCFNWSLHSGIEPENIDMEEKFGITLQKAQSLRAIPTLVVI